MKELEKIFFWGTGHIAREINESFAKSIAQMNIAGYIDNDRTKTGDSFFGKTIFLPDRLQEERKCFVIILSADFEEIQKQIESDYIWLVDKIDNYYCFIKERLLERYENDIDIEKQELCKNLRNHPLEVFNYPFTSKYKNLTVSVDYDNGKGLYYTCFQGKKMYFARRLNTKERVEKYYKQILMEQDKDSPHKYLCTEFDILKGDVIIDAGVAEGNFALSVIDRVKKVYLFEPDREWAEALSYTFAPYADKTVIVNKYVSNFEGKNTTTLDASVSEPIDFIKMDIEGEEYYALQGACGIIEMSRGIKGAICVYHQEFDEMAIRLLLEKFGMRANATKGYIWFPYDKDYIYSLPSLRKAVLRAEGI